MSLYTFAPIVLLSIIRLNTGMVNKMTAAVSKTAKVLILFCINRALSVFFGGFVFLLIELILVFILISIVTDFYNSFNIFDKKLNFYTYGIKQFFNKGAKHDNWRALLYNRTYDIRMRGDIDGYCPPIR